MPASRIPALRGRRVIVTRARPQAGALTGSLQAAGAEALEIPTIELRDPEDWGPADAALERLSSYDLVIFTSANGVERFCRRLAERGRQVGELGGRTLMAIGPATAAALEQRGLTVEHVPAEYRAEAVLEIARRLLPLDGRAAPRPPQVLIPRALQARQVLPDGLRQAGARVDVVPVYRAVAPEGSREALREALERGVDAVTFTSSSTVRNFLRLLGDDRARSLLRGVTIACIGPITADTAREAGLQVSVQPADYTVEALARALQEHYAAKR